MMLKGKIIRLVNMTVVITLFLSTLNVSNMNIPLSFSETQETQVYQESAETQPVFEDHARAPNLDIYSDYYCTIPSSNVDWGEIEVGSSLSYTLYIKNNGVVDLVASLVTENWYPETSIDYMTLKWDYNGQVLSPGEVVAVTLTLNVRSDYLLLNAFSFDIVIIGS